MYKSIYNYFYKKIKNFKPLFLTITSIYTISCILYIINYINTNFGLNNFNHSEIL